MTWTARWPCWPKRPRCGSAGRCRGGSPSRTARRKRLPARAHRAGRRARPGGRRFFLPGRVPLFALSIDLQAKRPVSAPRARRYKPATSSATVREETFMSRCPEHASHPARHGMRLAVCTLILAGACLPARPAGAAEPAAPDAATSAGQRRYDIPAGPLRTLLTRFASEAGIYLAGLRAGAGRRAVPPADRCQWLRPLPVVGAGELPTATARAQGDSATGPVVGYLAQRSATAAKTDTSIVETPQSISVVTAEQIR